MDREAVSQGTVPRLAVPSRLAAGRLLRGLGAVRLEVMKLQPVACELA